MSVSDSLLVSLFGISIVFIVLISLSLILRLQSYFFSHMLNKKEENAANSHVNKASEMHKDNEVSSNNHINENVVQISNGELKLLNVDVKTAALVMAIVSDELQTPLEQLQFKYIKAVE